ncbi:AhpC/TSA family protein [Parabacteroides sp. OttesenSCG-928-K15]|nr:AhpC/TSA family protein [Parabacteroides sp. OttesenSCG-928-K15]
MNTKKKFCKDCGIYTVLIFLFAACTPPNTVTGHIEGITNDTILVDLFSFSGNENKQDTIFAKNGRFKYTFPDNAAYGLMFSFPQFYVQNRPTGGVYTPNNSSLTVFAEQGERISIKGATNSTGLINATISGSNLNRDFSVIQNKTFEIRVNEVEEEMALERAMMDKNKENENNGWAKRRERNKALRELYSDYINQNLNNPLSAFLLCNQPLDSIGFCYDKLGEKALNSIFRNMLDMQMQRYVEYSNVRKAQKEIVVGNKAPDFTLEDIDGKPLSLSSLLGQGKYVIIDFWGSWCGPCIAGMPNMKKLYEKYKGKLEILGVACKETSVNDWREAVKKHKLPWINVYNDDQTAVNVKYGIEAYPTKIVINPEGTIMHIEEGEGDYTKIESVIK